jgi:hypothetical protein
MLIHAKRARCSAFLLIACISGTAFADEAGRRISTSSGVRESTAEIQTRQPAHAPKARIQRPVVARALPAAVADAPAVASFPADVASAPIAKHSVAKAHGLSLSFDGATLADSGAFPPDTMGAIGPAQFLVFVNGVIRSFDKAGFVDGGINVAPDTFFASVMTPV